MFEYSTGLDEFASQRSKRTKAQRRQARKAARTAEKIEMERVKVIHPLNDKQREYFDALADCDQVFAVGEAGGGKTFVAAHHAMSRLLDNRISTIYVTRPSVSKAKHKQGFLPGNADDKIAPWLVPIMDGMRAACSAATVERYKKEGKIEFVAFEFMRGRTLKNAAIILDEAQNCDLGDLRMFLTRIGENTQVIVCGDPSQTDIPNSGLDDVLDMIEEQDLSAEIVEFTEDDVVRSEIAKEWVKAFIKRAE